MKFFTLSAKLSIARMVATDDVEFLINEGTSIPRRSQECLSLVLEAKSKMKLSRLWESSNHDPIAGASDSSASSSTASDKTNAENRNVDAAAELGMSKKYWKIYNSLPDGPEGIGTSSNEIIALLSNPKSIEDWKFIKQLEDDQKALGDCSSGSACARAGEIEAAQDNRKKSGLIMPAGL